MKLTTRNERRRPSGRDWIRTGVVIGAAVALVAPLQAASASERPAVNRSTLLTAPVPTTEPPRTIITTDPELDDLNSMLRMLLYSNEIDIVGLVYSASQHHYLGDPAAGIEPFRWPAPGDTLHIDQAVNAYEEVYDNLVVHDSSYPSPTHLRSLIKTGNIKDVGDMSEETEGSEHIEKILLDDEPGQVFLQAWGGPNTIARALKSIEEQYKGTPQWDAVYDRIVDKTVITSWGQQDTTFADYIKPNWPDIQNREVSTSIWGYGARGVALPADQLYLTVDWTRANVSEVGPLGRAYRVWGDGKQMAAGFDDEDYFGLSGYTADELEAMGYAVWTPPQAAGSFISEGDSSNFALLLDNGLRSWEHPSWGGWGGRQIVDPADPNRWSNRGAVDADATGATPRDYPAARFFSAIQNDFAARLAWSVTGQFADANHEPTVSVGEGLDLTARPGETVELTSDVDDPDGDDVAVSWWNYREAGTYPSAVPLSAASGGSTSLTVPADAEPGQTIHVIVQGKDDGAPALTSYQRVVVTVASPTDGEGIPVTAELPELGGPEGALTLSVADVGSGVTLTGPTNVGDRLRFDGALPKITVTDTRNDTQAADSGWSVAGRASDFVAQDAQFSAGHLGWAPWADDLREGVQLGDPVRGVLRGGPGLANPATLVSAPSGARLGVAEVNTDLRLEVPVDTPDGSYTSQVTVSLFPVD
jgi:hypothetical protein